MKLRFALLSLLTLSACATQESIKIHEAQYWQRINVSDSTYMRGVKAQQMLGRDIAKCVTELRELERLGLVKAPLQTDRKGRLLDMNDLDLRNLDLPERDGALFAEHREYHDFYGCMLANGWERTEYVPYKVMRNAEDNYYRTQIKHQEQRREEAENASLDIKPTYND